MAAVGQYLIQIHTLISTLQDQQQTLDQALANDTGPVWIPDGEGARHDRHAARQALTQLFHNDNLVLPPTGLIGLPDGAESLVEDINATKDALRQEVKSLRQAAGRKKTSIMFLMAGANEHVRDPAISQALQSLNSQRINLLWVYRQLAILPRNLDSISWSWAHTRAIRKTHREEAIMLADKLSDAARDIAIDKLMALPAGTPLAHVKPVAPHLRANLTFRKNADPDAPLLRRMITTPSVLLLPQSSLPRIRWPNRGPEEGDTRLSRRDQKIEDTPLIHAMNLYRYRSDI